MDEMFAKAAGEVADTTDTDVLVYSGSIERGHDDKLLDLLMGMRHRRNVLLLLCSNGGNPDAAYRMARGLQNCYEKFTVLLAGRCKSAGTLMVLGAHEIVMTDHAELGPLDIQLGKKDELFELNSGLTVLNALTELESKAFELFEKTLFRMKVRSGGSVTLKTATQIATELAKGIVSPIIAQIDPMHVGEVSRALKIGKQYGERLSAHSNNLNEGSLDRLVEEYPSHGFVIDRKEASELFVNVRKLTASESALVQLLGAVVRTPSSAMDDPILFFVSETRKEAENDSNYAQDAGPGETSAGTTDSGDTKTVGVQEPPRPGKLAELVASQRNGSD